ncbi:hypothetical protein EKO04_002827 [Ascochyta lentis]|uniref:Uncharacterized protein n=1 Tax=Ascochyta lentis TaxID=205686 RepID=A0A8H7J9C9_9PLEO|nr:hypothetical protein EKO04_002827 [Ascochyta lentis]
MSLRPDDRSRRSRSKSPGRARERSRSRSRSHVRESSAAAAASASASGPGQHYSAAEYAPIDVHSPQYDIRQPLVYPTTVNEPITMGNYADLPPDQRPGYMQHAHPAAHYQQPIAYANAANVSYTATPHGGQPFAYTTAPTRDPAASFQYAQAPDKITFSARPVAGSAHQPPIRHTAQPASPSYPPPPPGQPQYVAVSHAPAPPPVAQPQYPPPPMGAHPRVQSTTAPPRALAQQAPTMVAKS